MNLKNLNEATELAANEGTFLLVGGLSMEERKPIEYILGFCISKVTELKQPLKIFIDSWGGDAGVFYLFKEFLENIHLVVETEVSPVGQAASAAGLIYLLGDKRTAYPNSKFLYHKTTSEYTYASLKKRRRENRKLAERYGYNPGLATGKGDTIIRQFFSERIAVSEVLADSFFEQDRYITSNEALDWGIVTNFLSFREVQNDWYDLLYKEAC